MADDWGIMAGRARLELTPLGFAWVLVALRVPLCWRRARGVIVCGWAGLELNLSGRSLDISVLRAVWLTGWFDQVLAANPTLMRELREVLGEMGFVYGALVADKPFLAPLFVFLGTRPPGSCTELPPYVRMGLV